jgi:hypothetical protein
MAKQTNTGGAYQNYQIIKNGDTTGSSEALAKGIATFTDSIAKNSKARAVANEEFQKQFKAAKKEASAQSDARAIIRQESILNAGNTIKDSGISAKMQKQYTTAMETEIVRIANWSKNVDSPYSTPNEKKEAHQKILEAKQRIASLNKSLGVAGQLRANSNINSERRQSQGTNWNYNPKITRDASGNVENIDYSYSQNMEYVLNGGSGADVELTQEEDGPWNITSKTNKEHVGKGNLDFDISIPNFIDPDFKLTTDYTPVIPNASQRVVNGAMAQLEGKPTDKMDPKMLEPNVLEGEDGKPGKIRYIDENGKAWDAINNSLFKARALASSTVAVSELQSINNVNDSNNVLLDQLGMTPESWEVATNGKADTLKGMEEQVGEQVFKRTEELAMSALNFKKFDGVIYRVSDNQPEKPTVIKPGDKEKDAYYWKDNTKKLFGTTNLSAEDPNIRTTAEIMPEVLPVQIGSPFQGGKITNLKWGEDSVIVSYSGSSDEEADPNAAGSYDTAIKAPSIPGSVTLSYNSVKQMTTLAESVGGSLKNPRAASVLALQIANNN